MLQGEVCDSVTSHEMAHQRRSVHDARLTRTAAQTTMNYIYGTRRQQSIHHSRCPVARLSAPLPTQHPQSEV